MKKIIIILTSLVLTFASFADNNKFKPIIIKKGKVSYVPDAKGNVVLDYSYCGYRQQDEPIPDAPVSVYVPWHEGDQSHRIQQAIDYVSALKVDKSSGLRGAVLIAKGIHKLSEPIRIKTSGVVLRGVSKQGTILRKEGVSRGAVVYVEGMNDITISDTLKVIDPYVAVGCKIITVDASGLHLSNVKKGDRLIVVRPSTKEWIASMGCDEFGAGLSYWGWKEGEIDVRWHRRVVSKDDSTITLDAPLTVSLDRQWGQSYVLLYTWNGVVKNSGVENLSLESVASKATDENHAWDGIYIDAAEDCWVRRVDFRGFAGSAVIVQRMAQQVTIEDCRSYFPMSELGGWRRRTFLTMGGKTLFMRCYSEDGINDFSAGFCAPGPNAFVQCEAENSHGMSGSSASWATGILCDNVNISGGSISFKNLELDKWGTGWNSASSVIWQCSASKIDCYNAANDARSYAVGCWGYCQGDGFWLEVNNHINSPRSLFHYQLATRKGRAVADSCCHLLMRNLDGATSPSVEKARKMAEEALMPRINIEQWIDSIPFTASVCHRDAKVLKYNESPSNYSIVSTIGIENGRFSNKGRVIAGGLHRTPWWNGRPRYANMDKADYAVTRFFPGTEQRGGTDRIDSIVAAVERDKIVVWNQNYGLWYDRRRDDHERIQRPDADVWPPFYEQSVARSGQGRAWDGLSIYDLSQLNSWYYHRLCRLADATPNMLIINQHFFQHNILEAGAHWVDAPWRSVNNIQSVSQEKNDMGFLEPVPFTGDKRIFTADMFYDTTLVSRAAIYRKYIYNVLDATINKTNIYHSVSEEYTGPQHFVEFWLSCIMEWERKRQRKANIVLNATYDVTNSIMSNQRMASLIDAIVIEQWHFSAGKLYAPKGGLNLAPRQHQRLERTANPTFTDVYNTVRDMVQRYPCIPIIYYAKGYKEHPWAIVMAGGSCPALNIKSTTISKALLEMVPVSMENGIYKMEGKHNQLIYNHSNDILPINVKGCVEIVNMLECTLKKANGKRFLEPGEMVLIEL